MASKEVGKILSLHLHSDVPNKKMVEVKSMKLVEGKGIEGNRRYFNKVNGSGNPNKRQVSLIEREVIKEHEEALSTKLEPGVVRSNIETTDIYLYRCVNRYVKIGSTAILFIYESRDPCNKMDQICKGLRELMENGKQGVLAQVIVSGEINVGDVIEEIDYQES